MTMLEVVQAPGSKKRPDHEVQPRKSMLDAMRPMSSEAKAVQGLLVSERQERGKTFVSIEVQPNFV